MKIPNLTKEARAICEKAYRNKVNHFHNQSFVDDYISFCKATDYKDISAENFMVYMKIYGDSSQKQRHRQFQSVSPRGGRSFGHNRMLKHGEAEKDCNYNLVEEYRIEMMKRMRNANK